MVGKPQHGLSYTPEYRAWQTIRQRCFNPDCAAYPDYGGRGITMCERWRNSPAAFMDDVGLRPSPKHEIDRIDNGGNYEPGNTRWVLRPVNCRNRRSNRLVEYHGETRTLAEWCEMLKLPRWPISKRLAAGWSPEKAFTEPVRPKQPNGAAKRRQP